MEAHCTQTGKESNGPDLLSNFEKHLVTYEQISFRIARDYGYSVGKFSRWTNNSDPIKAQAMKYYRFPQEKTYQLNNWECVVGLPYTGRGD